MNDFGALQNQTSSEQEITAMIFIIHWESFRSFHPCLGLKSGFFHIPPPPQKKS
jgi:hypothetical protein